MEQKINIAELLKDCPSGMELDCIIYEDVYFDYVDELNIIHCYIPHKIYKTSLIFNQDGTLNSIIKSKCAIFPKGKTTWEGFQRPFKDGDIVATENGLFIGIVKVKNNVSFDTYCAINDVGSFSINTPYYFGRFATEEEKQKLFDAIKANGYNWNAETKTLEKLPKFKVGDEIVKRNSISNSWIISSVSSKYYGLKLPNGIEGIGVLPVSEQDDWELLSDKFDINTLKPFESKVLVRDTNSDNWIGAFYSHYKSKKFYTIGSVYYYQCIPYEGNEHLLDTNNDCDEFYKTWKNG